MVQVRPFRGLRPPVELVHEVATPPWDTMESAEVRARALGNPNSFLHIDRPEVDARPGHETDELERLRLARDALGRFVVHGTLRMDERPGFYPYRLSLGSHTQLGVMGIVACDDYDNNRVRKHEHTLVAKETDRIHHIDAISCQASPVFLTYRPHDDLRRLLRNAVERSAPVYDLVADGVRHELWYDADPTFCDAVTHAFAGLDFAYIADGHHRSASASRVRALRAKRNLSHTGTELYNYLLAGLFPSDEMQILEYNRVVHGLNGYTPETLLAAFERHFDVAPAETARPDARARFGVYIAGRWWRLSAREATLEGLDVVGRLDVALLQTLVLEPLLGIADPRTDARIGFVGGIRGTTALEDLVRAGRYDVAFALYPTSIDDMMAISDMGSVMPPKSTWFEPKLRSGLLLHPLDGLPPPELEPSE